MSWTLLCFEGELGTSGRGPGPSGLQLSSPEECGGGLCEFSTNFHVFCGLGALHEYGVPGPLLWPIDSRGGEKIDY